MFKYQLLSLWAAAMSRLYMGLVVATSTVEHKLATFNASIERRTSDAEDSAHNAALAAAQDHASEKKAAHFANLDAAHDAVERAKAYASSLEDHVWDELAKLNAFASAAERKHFL